MLLQSREYEPLGWGGDVHEHSGELRPMFDLGRYDLLRRKAGGAGISLCPVGFPPGRLSVSWTERA